MLGFRPEDIAVSVEARPDFVRATVYMSEPLGRENLLTLKLGNTLFKVLASPDIHVALDQAVWLTFNADRVHLFDKATSTSLTSAEGA